jgi:hypothetical protein
MFGGLVESLASQALLYMGAMRDPMTGQVHQDLQQAQTMIEMLGMIEEKTKGQSRQGRGRHAQAGPRRGADALREDHAASPAEPQRAR